MIGADDPEEPEASGFETMITDRPMPSRLRILTKCDLRPAPVAADLAVSALTGAGMDALRARLADFAMQATDQAGPPPLTRQRHRELLKMARDDLHRASSETEPELRAEALRLAMSAIGGITGKVGVEALLDRVFSDFCIGK